MDNVAILREALTSALVTIQKVYSYAVMDSNVLTEVTGTIEQCESTLQLTDDL